MWSVFAILDTTVLVLTLTFVLIVFIHNKSTVKRLTETSERDFQLPRLLRVTMDWVSIFALFYVGINLVAEGFAWKQGSLQQHQACWFYTASVYARALHVVAMVNFWFERLRAVFSFV